MFYGKIFTSAPITCLALSFYAVCAGHATPAEAQTSSFSLPNSVASSVANQRSQDTTEKSLQALISQTLGDDQLFPLEIQILNPAAQTGLLGQVTGQIIPQMVTPSSLQPVPSMGVTSPNSQPTEPQSNALENHITVANEFFGSISSEVSGNKGEPEKNPSEGTQLAAVSSQAQPAAGNSSSPSNPSNAANNSNTSSGSGSLGNKPNSAANATNVAKIYAHTVDGKPAATVYVRGIPVMTFVEGESQPRQKELPRDLATVANQPNTDSKQTEATQENKPVVTPDKLQASTNPIERAAAVASLINQMNRDGADASKITPEWQSGDFVIKFGDRGTLRFDQSVRLPETTKERATDVLESANLIRRLVGGANPLTTVLNAPPTPNNAVGQVLSVASGIASWYGPGFAGNLSANGEIFDPEAMTAAHPSLPFGTMVRVINMDNGQAVVVRINDRGPYAHGRVIDLSAGAARSINMMSTGVAPVKLEVLGAAGQ